MQLVRLALCLAWVSVSSVALAHQSDTFTDPAFNEARSDLILALRHALPMSKVQEMRETNHAFIAGLQFAMAHYGWDGSAAALDALVQRQGLAHDRAHMVCPPHYEPAPVGYGSCTLNVAGVPISVVEPLSETRGRVMESDGRVIFRVSTRFTITVAYHGRSVLLTRGFISTDLDAASGTITEGSSYGVTAATQFDGLMYDGFLENEVQRTQTCSRRPSP